MTKTGEVKILRSAEMHAAPTEPVDPILTEVVRNGLNSAADEMKIALQRTAFSPVIYEMIDFAAGLYDAKVRLLAQATALPCFLGTMGLAIEAALEAIGGPGELAEGDVVWSTDGYANGSHPQDAVVIVPVFFEGELIAYSTNKAHQLDIAAKAPYCTDTTDVFQEGVIFPAVKLYVGGERQEDLYRTLQANSRFPDALAGDVAAQVSSAHVGAAALLRLVERFGKSEFDGAVERMFEHGEQTVRRLIEELPDGRYEAECSLDSNGVEEGQVHFRVAAEIAGSNIAIDFTDSPSEQAGPMNCPWASTVSYARLFVQALLGGSELPNEGHFRPVEVRAKVGTMFCPEPPAPIYLYGWPPDCGFEGLIRAVAGAAPDRLPAGSGGDLCGFMFWGEDSEGKLQLIAADHVVGQGASARGDAGSPLIFLTGSGIRSSPIEVVEQSYDVLVLHNELATDSGGAGEHRGGLGVDIEYQLEFDCEMTNIVERQTTPPLGLMGGGPGRANKVMVHTPDGRSELSGKTTGFPLPKGTRIELHTGGGGGWGDPAERSEEALRADVAAGYVSEAAAAEWRS
jgi:N-methylhydantoinase B